MGAADKQSGCGGSRRGGSTTIRGRRAHAARGGRRVGTVAPSLASSAGISHPLGQSRHHRDGTCRRQAAGSEGRDGCLKLAAYPTATCVDRRAAFCQFEQRPRTAIFRRRHHRKSDDRSVTDPGHARDLAQNSPTARLWLSGPECILQILGRQSVANPGEGTLFLHFTGAFHEGGKREPR